MYYEYHQDVPDHNSGSGGQKGTGTGKIRAYQLTNDGINVFRNADQIATDVKSSNITDYQKTLTGLTFRSITRRVAQQVWHVLYVTFLPAGYPHSVRPEYLMFQLWDSLQGICSYLRSVLTTRSLLAGTGVGSAESAPLAAAIAWVLRDGLGMLGSLVFAYVYADALEVYVKEWRYFADILNNIGLTLDLLSSYFPDHFFALTAVSTLCKSWCGLVAGATKVRISAHFAAPGHLADVVAKESTQETAVALCGILLGMLLARVIGDDDVSIWAIFLSLLSLHQMSNYFLMRVLVFDTLNPLRAQIIATTAFRRFKARAKTTALVLEPEEVAAQENLVKPLLLYWYGPVFGGQLSIITNSINSMFIGNDSLSQIEQEQVTASLGSSSSIFRQLLRTFAAEEFIVGLCSSSSSSNVVVCLKRGCSLRGLVKAHFIGFYVDEAMRAAGRKSLLQQYELLLCDGGSNGNNNSSDNGSDNGSSADAREDSCSDSDGTAAVATEALRWYEAMVDDSDMQRLWLPAASGSESAAERLQQSAAALQISCGKWRFCDQADLRDKIE